VLPCLYAPITPILAIPLAYRMPLLGTNQDASVSQKPAAAGFFFDDAPQTRVPQDGAFIPRASLRIADVMSVLPCAGLVFRHRSRAPHGSHSPSESCCRAITQRHSEAEPNTAPRTRGLTFGTKLAHSPKDFSLPGLRASQARRLSWGDPAGG